MNGLSALQLGFDLEVQYKAAFVLMQKLRQRLMESGDETPLSGEDQVVRGDVGDALRPTNQAEERVDRRLAAHQSPDKPCVLVRETYPTNVAPSGRGAGRRDHENQAE